MVVAPSQTHAQQSLSSLKKRRTLVSSHRQTGVGPQRMVWVVTVAAVVVARDVVDAAVVGRVGGRVAPVTAVVGLVAAVVAAGVVALARQLLVRQPLASFFSNFLLLKKTNSEFVCMCVCVCVCERERECVCE